MLKRQELENIAILAKLEIPSDKFDKLLSDMSEVVKFADKINSVSLSDEAFFGFDGLKNRFRADEVEKSFDQTEILKNCKVVDEGFFVVNLNSNDGG
ncbi:MAG: Asp-tRNA(Asn)/Glu-tRNA(Gln) amidotransferase subunit GatC [Desulfovibrionaceae bacterium]|nr:Asp-tRNA(Asn)/Glu-tRNA(Gln) amidotransferase subunit GatC [Desulfovibrionaceae bacterium]